VATPTGARDSHGVPLAVQMLMPVAPFPHRYTTELQADSLVAAPRAPIRVGSPPQFGGSDDVWSPEQLLVGAALSCLKATFDAYAKRDRLVVREWRGRGTGVLVKGSGGPVFETIDLHVELVTDEGDAARAESVLGIAERNCIVSRALSAAVHVTSSITSPARAAATI
jgi:organic hydroperoxide reductase OsmC/OhrA